jgi:hypothetical protein
MIESISTVFVTPRRQSVKKDVYLLFSWFNLEFIIMTITVACINKKKQIAAIRSI